MEFEILQETPQVSSDQKVAIQAKQQAPKPQSSRNKEILAQLLALSQQNIKKIFNISEKFEENSSKQVIDNEIYEKYSTQLLELFETGFNDFTLNMQALTKFGGDLEKSKKFIKNQETKKFQNYENHVKKVLNDNIQTIQGMLQNLEIKVIEVQEKLVKNTQEKSCKRDIEQSQDVKEARKMTKKEQQAQNKQEKFAKKQEKVAQKIEKMGQKKAEKSENGGEISKELQDKDQKLALKADKIAEKVQKMAQKAQKIAEKKSNAIKEVKKQQQICEKQQKNEAEKVNNNKNLDLPEKITKIYVNGPDHFAINKNLEKLNKAGKGNTVGQAIIAKLCNQSLLQQDTERFEKVEVIFNSAQQPENTNNFEVKSSKPQFTVPEYLLDVAEKSSQIELEENILFVTKCKKLTEKLVQKGAKNVFSAQNFFALIEKTLETQKFEALIDSFAQKQQ